MAVVLKEPGAPKFPLFAIPSLSGVSALSSIEIRRDLREIERILASQGAHSDSECSVKSADILPSSYPVKPRRLSLRPSTSNLRRGQGKETAAGVAGKPVDTRPYLDSAFVQDAADFLKIIQKNKPRLHAWEQEREDYEIQDEMFLSSAVSAAKQFLQRKHHHVAYLRVLQGVLLRAAAHHGTALQHVSMVADIHQLLRRQQQSLEILQDAHARREKYLVDQKANKSGGDVASKEPAAKGRKSRRSSGSTQSATTATTTAAAATSSSSTSSSTAKRGLVQDASPLAVRIHLSSHPSSPVLLRVGMWVRTAFGEGQVYGLHPDEGKLTVKLNFGSLFCTFSQLLAWQKGDAVDVLSPGLLAERWSTWRDCLNLPVDRQAVVSAEVVEGARELNSELKGSLSSSSSPSLGSSSTTVPKTFSDVIVDADGRGKGKGLREKAKPRKNDFEEVVAVAGAVAASAPISSLTVSEGDIDVTDLHSAAVAGESAAPATAVATAASRYSGDYSQTLSLFADTGKVKDFLSSAEPSVHMLELALAPAVGIAAVVDHREERMMKEKSFSAHIWRSALAAPARSHGLALPDHLGTVTLSKIPQLERYVEELKNDLTQLERKRKQAANQAEGLGLRCASIAQETASLRLQTFTRRVLRRNNLAAVGVCLPMTPAESLSGSTATTTSSSGSALTASPVPGSSSSSSSTAISLKNSPAALKTKPAVVDRESLGDDFSAEVAAIEKVYAKSKPAKRSMGSTQLVAAAVEPDLKKSKPSDGLDVTANASTERVSGDESDGERSEGSADDNEEVAAAAPTVAATAAPHHRHKKHGTRWTVKSRNKKNRK